jgi:hypothetical protein
MENSWDWLTIADKKLVICRRFDVSLFPRALIEAIEKRLWCRGDVGDADSVATMATIATT